MAKRDTLFTTAGITTHSNGNVTVTKVRYGTDLVRQVKMLNNPKKIEHRPTGACLAPVRVDIIELPSGMFKADALKFLATHADFQSAEDQALIADEQDKREPKAPRVKKEKAVKVAKQAKPSLDSIKSRAKKVTAEEVLAAVATTEIAE